MQSRLDSWVGAKVPQKGFRVDPRSDHSHRLGPGILNLFGPIHHEFGDAVLNGPTAEAPCVEAIEFAVCQRLWSGHWNSRLRVATLWLLSLLRCLEQMTGTKGVR